MITPRFLLTTLYVLSFAFYGVLLPFLPIIIHARGFDDVDTQFAIGFFGVAGLLSPPFFAHFSDRVFKARQLIPALMICVSILLLFFLQMNTVFAAGLLIFLTFFFYLPVNSILDQMIMQFIADDKEPRKKDLKYEHFRVWGSVGFMLPTLLLPLLSLRMEIDASLLIVLSSLLSFLTALCCIFLPDIETRAKGAELPSKAALKRVIKAPVRDIFIATFMTSMGMSIFYNVFPRLLQELNLSIVEVGLVINLGVLFELYLIPHTSRIIKKLGFKYFLIIAIGATVLRFVGVAVHPALWLIIVLQILHAPTVLGIFVAMPPLLRTLAEPGYRHSLISLYVVAVIGAARIAGPWLSAYSLSALNLSGFDGLTFSILLAAILATFGLIWAYLVLDLPEQ